MVGERRWWGERKRGARRWKEISNGNGKEGKGNSTSQCKDLTRSLERTNSPLERLYRRSQEEEESKGDDVPNLTNPLAGVPLASRINTGRSGLACLSGAYDWAMKALLVLSLRAVEDVEGEEGGSRARRRRRRGRGKGE